MPITGVESAANVLSGLHANGSSKLEGSDGNVFSDFLSQAIGQAQLTTADSAAFNDALLLGEVNNLHTAPIAAREAELAISLTVQIRDRIVDAYTEIMRMQV